MFIELKLASNQIAAKPAVSDWNYYRFSLSIADSLSPSSSFVCKFAAIVTSLFEELLGRAAQCGLTYLHKFLWSMIVPLVSCVFPEGQIA
mgnify:CR=1 FL=1